MRRLDKFDVPISATRISRPPVRRPAVRVVMPFGRDLLRCAAAAIGGNCRQHARGGLEDDPFDRWAPFYVLHPEIAQERQHQPPTVGRQPWELR